MGAEAAFQALASQLRGADDRTLLKIVGVVDRLARRGSLDRVLDAHRVRLAAIRPPRPMTVARLFVMPFEELLVDGAAWSPGMMRVPRDRLGRLVALLQGELEPAVAAAAGARLAGRTMDDSALLLEVGRTVWPACGAAVERILARGRQTKDPEIRDLLTPLRIAQALLQIAEPVVTTVWALPPRPMLALDAAARAKIAELLGLASAAGRDCFQLAAELLVTRSELPLSIIEPVLDGAFELGERERQQAAAMIAEACQSDMVRVFRQLAALPESSDAAALVGPLRALVSNIESLQEVAQKVKFDHRELRKLKADVFALIEARLARTLQTEMLDAFAALADPAAMIDWRRLEVNAAAAANMRLMAKRIGLATKIDFVFSKAFERYRAILEASAGPAGAFDSTTMDRVRIIELLFGSRPALQLFTSLRRAA